MVGHGGSSAGSYLADPTSPIPSHCASIVATSTLRVNSVIQQIIIMCTDKENPFDITLMNIMCPFNTNLMLFLYCVSRPLLVTFQYTVLCITLDANLSCWTRRLTVIT